MTLPNFKLKIVAKEPTCADAIAVLKDTANNTILTEAIPSGATENITAPNATVTLNGGAFISPRSNQTVNSELEYLDGVNLTTPAEYSTSGNNIQLNRVSPKLLDIYHSPLLAYSAARLLRAGYHGSPLFRIRRSSDSAETDVFSDIDGNITLSSTVGAGGTLTDWIGSNNGFVVTLYDQSGNARHATNSTGSQQPQIITSGAFNTVGTGGKPAIRFTSASSQRLTLTNSIMLGAEFTSYIIQQRVISGTTLGVNIGGFPNSAVACLVATPVLFTDGNTYLLSFNNTGAQRSTGAITYNGTTLGLISTRQNNQTVNIRANASSIFSGSNSVGTISINYINALGAYGNVTANGWFQESVVWARDLGATDTAAIETNINTYYGIY